MANRITYERYSESFTAETRFAPCTTEDDPPCRCVVTEQGISFNYRMMLQ